MSKGN